MEGEGRTLNLEMATEEGPTLTGSMGRKAAQVEALPGPMGTSAPTATQAVASATHDDLELPEQEFTYLAGSTDRPWEHFKGRWKAIKPYLANMLKACGSNRPLRIADVGSCTGFFSLQAAYRHPEADIIAIEGSVGIGNGSVGMTGSPKQILNTYAVQTHFRWVQNLKLTNCFLAPEVWDYVRVCELASLGKPICDVMFLLSIIHHIDGVSAQQYVAAGLSRLDGIIDLIAKLLTLSPRHFVELPDRPWLACAYDAHRTPRGILQAAASASGFRWRFEGPIYSADWFGLRELWVLEVEPPTPQVDVQSCPFPLLFRENETMTEPELAEDGRKMVPSFQPMQDSAAITQLNGPLTDNAASNRHMASVSLVDPGLMMLSNERYGPPSDHVAEALTTAPTSLLIAHLTLRDAITEAQDVLKEFYARGVLDESHGRRVSAGRRIMGISNEHQPPPPLYNRSAAVTGLSVNSNSNMCADLTHIGSDLQQGIIGSGSTTGAYPFGAVPPRQPLRPGTSSLPNMPQAMPLVPHA